MTYPSSFSVIRLTSFPDTFPFLFTSLFHEGLRGRSRKSPSSSPPTSPSVSGSILSEEMDKPLVLVTHTKFIYLFEFPILPTFAYCELRKGKSAPLSCREGGPSDRITKVRLVNVSGPYPIRIQSPHRTHLFLCLPFSIPIPV